MEIALPPGLYLVPVPISEQDPCHWLEPEVRTILQTTPFVIAENARTARRFLSGLGLGIAIGEVEIEILNRDSGLEDIRKLAQQVEVRKRAILMSEAGCPAIADPGAELVNLLHKKGIPVYPQVGPSSLLLALMGSGLSGNRFCFTGYLPVKEPERTRALKKLEKESASEGMTQMVMDTPYRNQNFWNFLLKELRDDTLLCLAFDLRGPEQMLRQHAVGDWKKKPALVLGKKPALFLFQASPASSFFGKNSRKP